MLNLLGRFSCPSFVFFAASSVCRLNNWLKNKVTEKSAPRKWILKLPHFLKRSRFRHSLCRLRFLHTVSNSHKLLIDELQWLSDIVTESTLDLSLHDPGCKRTEQLVQRIVFAVANTEFEWVDADMYILHFEDRSGMFGSCEEVYSYLRTGLGLKIRMM